jgi:hypothetical protein
VRESLGYEKNLEPKTRQAATLTGHPKIGKNCRKSPHLFRDQRRREGPWIRGKPNFLTMLDDGIRRDREVHVHLAGGMHPKLSKTG